VNFPFYIAKRYLVSKKSHNIINIISIISIVGITIGTMALVLILSVFNGFENLVISLFNTFNPDLEVSLKEGKTFSINELPAEEIKNIPGVISLTEVVEENALLKNDEKQHIITIKGVSEEFTELSRLDTMLVEGSFQLKRDQQNLAVIGTGVAYFLDVHIGNYKRPLTVYVPNRKKSPGMNFESAFNKKLSTPSGIFSVQQDIDSKYVIVPIDFARDLLDYSDELTSLEINLSGDAGHESIQQSVEHILGERFIVRNRYQQEALLYNIMKSEKWVTFAILAFILLIAAFNVIGSLSMLILDKKKDIAILHSMGASIKRIRKIFIAEGVMITMIGGLAGLLLGGLLSWLQQTFGLIRLGATGGSFVVQYYPVQIQMLDFVGIFITVFLIGLFAAWYPVRQISRKYIRYKPAQNN